MKNDIMIFLFLFFILTGMVWFGIFKLFIYFICLCVALILICVALMMGIIVYGALKSKVPGWW